MDVKEAIRTLKEVGLNVYTSQTKDSGFIKLYQKQIANLMPKVSSNAIKVLLALSTELEWNQPEVIITVEKMAKITGLNRDAVRVALGELEENLVVKRLGPNVRRSYVISNCYVRVGKNK